MSSNVADVRKTIPTILSEGNAFLLQAWKSEMNIKTARMGLFALGFALTATALSACSSGTAVANQVGWKVTTSTDAITDAKDAFVSLYSTDGQEVLILQCNGGKSRALIGAPKVVSDQDYVGTTIRFGSDAPYVSDWATLTDHKYIEYRPTGSEDNSINDQGGFITKLLNSRTLVVRVRAVDDGGGFDAAFPTAGLADSLRQVSGYCDFGKLL